jgi:hypothetical protein
VNLLSGADNGAQSAVDAKDATINNRHDRELVECDVDYRPHCRAPGNDFIVIVQPVRLIDRARLVIPPEEIDLFREFDFQECQEGKCLER